jgi:uncharacterized membrane protein YdbT with pleckstrin-like domain
MGYVDENLISGEEVRYRARLHWTALAHWHTLTIILVAVGIALIVLGVMRDLIGATISGGVLLAIAIIVLIAANVYRNSAEFAITNKRVILKTGIIQRRTIEMFLSKIETVGVDQGLLGRMLDFGTIRLNGTGGTTEPFHRIARPLEFRRQVQEQMAQVL